MTNTTTVSTIRHQIFASDIREAVQEMLIGFILVTNNDQPGYDEASAIAAFDSELETHGSLGALLDYLTEEAV